MLRVVENHLEIVLENEEHSYVSATSIWLIWNKRKET